MCAVEVNLRVYGPHASDSVITLCRNQDYEVSLECTVIDNTNLEWTLEPILSEPARFTILNAIGEFLRDMSVNLLLTKTDGLLRSQFHVSSSVLRDTIIDQGEPLTIECLSSTVISNISIKISGKL